MLFSKEVCATYLEVQLPNDSSVLRNPSYTIMNLDSERFSQQLTESLDSIGFFFSGLIVLAQ